jgi:molecular chaperone GrpE
MDKETYSAEAGVREAERAAAGDRSVECASMRPATRAGNETGTAQKEQAEWKERCLRLTADFDNWKKRAAQQDDQRAAEQKFALVRELLPVVDNLERALACGPAQTVAQLREGVELTLRQMTRLLNQHGLTGRDDLGQPFDPHYHEAVCVRSEPARAEHEILEVWQRGWVRGKELFRPAKVVVNKLKDSNPAGKVENRHHENATQDG